ncbi:MAG TPA: RDD family protein [Ferruginibacter sp.]|nr:RDD family protein [Ferruginibacter sp.]
MEQGKNLLGEFEGADKAHVYATFLDRFLAVIIDMLLLGIFTIPINWYNETSVKSPVLLIIVAIVSIVYKPLLEFKYGATVGKMVMKIIVVNTAFQPLDLKEAILRNIFEWGSKIYSLILGLIVFARPGFELVRTYKEYGNFSNYDKSRTHWILVIYMVILITEIGLLLSDDQQRSLHDRIGGTLVIRKPD